MTTGKRWDEDFYDCQGGGVAAVSSTIRGAPVAGGGGTRPPSTTSEGVTVRRSRRATRDVVVEGSLEAKGAPFI